MFRGKLNAPRVEWLNKGFMAVWSPIIVGRRKKRRVSQHTRCNGRRTLATCRCDTRLVIVIVALLDSRIRLPTDCIDA
eukprot:934867-Pyramimonas_sp.AAC.2